MKRFTTSDGLSLAYEDEGKGQPVLCLPGLTRNSRDFDLFAEQFSRDYRIIRLDFRGRGESAYDENFQNYHPAVEARDVVELLAHLGLEKTTIIGTSRGGIVAMVLAATAKQVLEGVVLVDIGPVIEREGLDEIAGYLGIRPKYKTVASAALAASLNRQARFPGVGADRWNWFFSNNWYDAEDGIRLRYDRKLRNAFLGAMEEAGEMPDTWPLFDAFEGLPLALIHGENSDILSQATADEMRARRPDMMYASVPGRGHIPFLDEPECVELLRRFLGSLKK